MKDENDKKTQELNLENSVGQDIANVLDSINHSIRKIDIANVLESSIRKIINQEMESWVENYNVLTEQNFHEFLDSGILSTMFCSEVVTQDTFIDELANNDIPCRDEIVDHDNVADIIEQAMQDYFLTNSFILKKGDK